jgi:hypothetical protein
MVVYLSSLLLQHWRKIVHFPEPEWNHEGYKLCWWFTTTPRNWLLRLGGWILALKKILDPMEFLFSSSVSCARVRERHRGYRIAMDVWGACSLGLRSATSPERAQCGWGRSVPCGGALLPVGGAWQGEIAAAGKGRHLEGGAHWRDTHDLGRVGVTTR